MRTLVRRGVSAAAPTLSTRGKRLQGGRSATLTGVGGGTRVAPTRTGLPAMRTGVRRAVTTTLEESMTLSDPGSAAQQGAAPEPGRPLVFRGGTVLPMDDSGSVLQD